MRFSMRTRSPSCSALRGFPDLRPRANALSCHSVNTTNGTPSSNSVSAAFTIPSPSLSAAFSSPGEETLTTTASRFSPLLFLRRVVDDSSSARYLSSLLTLRRSYVPKE